MSREKRQDLRAHLKPGAQGKGYGSGGGWQGEHRKKSGCPLLLLTLLAVPSAAVVLGWQLAAAVFGGAA